MGRVLNVSFEVLQNSSMGISTFLRLLLLYILPYCVSSSLHDLPIDASFDFGSSLEGWAEDGTSVETELIARVEAGELRASLLDRHPVLDSPFVALNITPVHFVVLRMKYTGTPALGRLLFLTPDISSNSSSSSLFVSESFLDIPWVARQPPSVVSSAASLSNHPASNVVDGDLTTYFESSITSGAFIIFDLKDYRSVDQINLLSPANTTSPRRCLLQRSLTSGVGPFTTVTSFTLSNTSTSFQTISGFVSSSARYWQLLLLDNYGGSSIVLNEVSFGGSDAAIHSISYPIYNDENYHMYYIPLSSLFPSSSSFLPISRLRLAFLYDPTLISATADIAIDYIRLIRAPVIERVTGCLDKYRFEEPLTSPAFFNVTLVENPVNTNIIIRSFVKNMMDLQYAQTFDCPLQGGIPLLIQGYNFGRASLVDINGAECQVLSRQVSASNGRYESIICTLPPGHAGPAGVTVRNGFNVNVSTTVPALYYR